MGFGDVDDCHVHLRRARDEFVLRPRSEEFSKLAVRAEFWDGHRHWVFLGRVSLRHVVRLRALRLPLAERRGLSVSIKRRRYENVRQR